MSPRWQVVCLVVMLPVAAQQVRGIHRYRVAVPSDVATRQVHLVLRNVIVPSNRSVILRAYIAADGSPVYLGSTALVAVAPAATGVSRTELLRINVTAGLRRWMSGRARPDTGELRIVPKDGQGHVLDDLEWSSGRVELVHPQ